MSKDVFLKKTPAFPILINFTKMSKVCLDIFDNSNLYNKLNTSSIISQNKSYKLKVNYTGKINVFIIEDCGDTLVKYISKEKKLLGNYKEDTKSLDSILFQCIHAVYSINKHGFIHGDTHMSNITVRETIKWFKVENSNLINNKKVRYSIFTTGINKYKIPFYGAYITLIDLGRAVDISFIKRKLFSVSDFYKKEEIILSLDNKIHNKEHLDNRISKLSDECILNIYNFVDILRIVNGMFSLLHSTTSSSKTHFSTLNNVKKYISSRISNIIEEGSVMSLEQETEKIIKDNFTHFIYEESLEKINNVVDTFI
jgi:hypothetical protein